MSRGHYLADVVLARVARGDLCEYRGLCRLAELGELSNPDWAAIEPEYRAGRLSVAHIADHHFVSDSGLRKHAKAHGWTRDGGPETDWDAIERAFRAGQVSIRVIGRQHSLSDAVIRTHAKAEGWTRDLAGEVRNRVRESLVREGSRKSERMGVVPSDAAIIDEAAAIGVAVVREHRRDIEGLRKAAAELLSELRPKPQEASAQWDGADEVPLIHRSRVIADLSAAMARLVPLERQAFGLDEDRPGGSQPMTVVWEGMPCPAYD